MTDQTKTLKVTIKRNYGQDHVYPACDQSRLFVAIQGGKTLTPATRDLLKAAGYTFEQYADEVAL